MDKLAPSSIFDDIVVVINFTFPHYNNIDFLVDLYRFPRIVFYGPLNTTNDVRVTPCNVENGYFSYRIFLDVFKKHQARGIMLVHDDFLLNREAFERLDADKIWSQPWSRNPIKSWYWWNKDIGKTALLGAMKRLGHDSEKPVHGYSDLMYIPTKMIEHVREPLEIFSDHNVFIELAWPNVLKACVKPSECQFLNTVNHVFYEHGRTAWQNLYSKSLHGIHPVKWTNPQNRIDAARLIAK